MRSIKQVVLGLMAFALMSTAHAGMLYFDFTSNDNSFNVNGQIIYDDANQPYTNGQGFGHNITSITGTVTGLGGGEIIGLLNNPNAPDPYLSNGFLFNNLIYPDVIPGNSSYFDALGVVFEAGNAYWNLWVTNDASVYNLYSYGPFGYGPAVDTLGAMLTAVDEPLPPGSSWVGPGGGGTVPEPGTLMLMGIGLIGFTYMSKRKQYKGG